VIAQFSLQPLAAITGELATVPLDNPVTAAQYARLVELRRRTPALERLGALDDTDLAAVAASLCHAELGDCVTTTAYTLRCLADRCEVALPESTRHDDMLNAQSECHRYSSRVSSAPYGLGFDWGEGWQRSRYPSDGGAWSLGIDGRMRFDRTFGAVARVDRVAGRDEATDANHDGRDDFSTGSITRIEALAGPSIVLDIARYEESIRFARLDLLGGYVATLSQPDEHGPAAGFDLAYQLSLFQFGMRFVQGFGDARDATMLLAHVGLSPGSAPIYSDERDCGALSTSRSTPLALGMDIPLGGYGASSHLGYLAPGLGFEALWHVSHVVDAVTHADLVVYPGVHQDRVIHQAVLAGVRLDRKHSDTTTDWFATVMAGYSHGIGLTPTDVGSGPITDFSVGWGGEAAEGAGYIRLHARFGVGPDNVDYRAIFLSGGFELRLDPHRWRDRD
jgi:hypothetical protein